MATIAAQMSGQIALIEAQKMKACWKTVAIAPTSIARNREVKTDMPERSKLTNQKRSQVWARVEHVYADMKCDGKKYLVRCIGQARAELRIGLMNMVYNARRWSFLSCVG
ncbi:hypothetical protein Q8W27_11160 [Oceanobacter sp. 2_MG-2023]|nr:MULTISPECIES: hypothetical protein [unclassified Oceanobacter]MDO6683183.1 hypothetical protein [Oceanobacter sp. 5_MG-2023]MDP2609470.1 hypothetical protein [Oceanobacter sp. 1_MG-2023]MDP2612830.1 hypothetical protein [Oceanobacter sp. 2_MG-2023]